MARIALETIEKRYVYVSVNSPIITDISNDDGTNVQVLARGHMLMEEDDANELAKNGHVTIIGKCHV
jgi:hypothetical protein